MIKTIRDGGAYKWTWLSQRQQKNEIIIVVNRNVPNFSLETEKAKFEINNKIKPMLTNTNIVAAIERIEFSLDVWKWK